MRKILNMWIHLLNLSVESGAFDAQEAENCRREPVDVDADCCVGEQLADQFHCQPSTLLIAWWWTKCLEGSIGSWFGSCSGCKNSHQTNDGSQEAQAEHFIRRPENRIRRAYCWPTNGSQLVTEPSSCLKTSHTAQNHSCILPVKLINMLANVLTKYILSVKACILCRWILWAGIDEHESDSTWCQDSRWGWVS